MHLCREEAIETDMSIGNGCQSLPAEQQRQQWMAQAETWVPTIPMGNMPMRSGAFPSVPLWADPQFHLLEMRSASQQAPVACAGRAESLASTSEPLDFRYGARFLPVLCRALGEDSAAAWMSYATPEAM